MKYWNFDRRKIYDGDGSVMIKRINNIIFLQEKEWVNEKAKMLSKTKCTPWHARKNHMRTEVGLLCIKL